MVNLSTQATNLLLKLVSYETKNGKASFGIFIGKNNNHKLVVKCNCNNFLEFELNSLPHKELIDALNELNETYLNYSVNMHYFVELTDKGRELGRGF